MRPGNRIGGRQGVCGFGALAAFGRCNVNTCDLQFYILNLVYLRYIVHRSERGLNGDGGGQTGYTQHEGFGGPRSQAPPPTPPLPLAPLPSPLYILVSTIVMLALRGLKCAAGCAQRVVLAPGYRGREPRVVVDTRPHGTWIGNPAYM